MVPDGKDLIEVLGCLLGLFLSVGVPVILVLLWLWR
jgi:hypothetical protein